MYFNKFPKIKYDFNRDGIINNVIDIFRQVRPLQNFVDEFSTQSKMPEHFNLGDRNRMRSKNLKPIQYFY